MSESNAGTSWLNKRNLKLFLIAVVAVIVVVFLIQNSRSVSVHFLLIPTMTMPLFVLLFLTLIVGGALALLVERLVFGKGKDKR